MHRDNRPTERRGPGAVVRRSRGDGRGRRGGRGRAADHALVGAHRHPLPVPEDRDRPASTGLDLCLALAGIHGWAGGKEQGAALAGAEHPVGHAQLLAFGVGDHEAVAAGVLDLNRRQGVVAAVPRHGFGFGLRRSAPREDQIRERWSRPGQ